MKPPVLHIHGNKGIFCNFVGNGSNWPEKYMKDEVARFLEYCENCEREYIERYSQERFDALKTNMRRDMADDNEICPGGLHPEQQSGELHPSHTQIIAPDEEGSKCLTLREYLNGDGDA